MKKILFIIPKLSTGGTNTSLDALYSRLKDEFDIHVFSISHQPISHNYAFMKVLLTQDLPMSLYFSNFSEQKGVYKILAFVSKVLLRNIFKAFRKDYGLFIFKRVAMNLERDYDYIVGYQEGYATHLASYFSNSNKYAWIHCDYSKHLLKIKNKSEEAIYSKFKKVISVSEYTTSVFANCYPSLSNRTLAINNLLDVSRIIKLAQEPIDDARFFKHDMTILSVGRFGPVKRFREIPVVASALKDLGLKFIWYVIGPKYGNDEFSSFTANMEKYKVYDCVQWLGGKPNPYPYFAAANLYVCLSESEACPMVFKEAHLFGLPIVSTDFPSSYEFIHEDDGIITSIDNLPKAIATMIRRIKTGFVLQPGKDDTQDVLNKIKAVFA